MVSMRFIFIGSVFLHGLLAFSIAHYGVHLKKGNPTTHFSVVWGMPDKKTNATQKTKSREDSSFSVDIDQGRDIAANVSENPLLLSPSVEIIANSAPVYPGQARREGAEGDFLVKIIINEGGTVESMEIKTIKGDKEIFEQAIFAALKTWKFKPKNKKIALDVPISFQLDS